MKHPDIPKNEEARLKSLHSLNVLDTDTEERFDRLTRLAKRMFDVPIAVVSLVDANRQWFKSCVGLDVSETPRDISFCGHAILGKEPFIIPDAALDDRFYDNPLVISDPYIRFYAGCPLRHLDGSMLGTLCIIDTQPRTLSDDDLAALKDLAGLAQDELMAVQLATLDDLTRISNRRGFLNLAKNSLDICARKNIPASMVFLDLNDFKQINDLFGHAEGDHALMAFATEIKHTFRESDVFARLGGDEFVVLLTDTSVEPAKQTVARFRQAINNYNKQSNRGYDISFCDGIVNVNHEQHATIEALLKEADSLMYESKQGASDTAHN